MSNEREHADSPALLPCPFCGSEPIMRRGGRYGFWALCEHCGAALLMSDTEADAARNWNRRAADKKAEEALSDEIAIRDEKIKQSSPGNAGDPLAAILAEMRDERIIRLDDADVTRCLLRNLADRIEAAVKRELSKNGPNNGPEIGQFAPKPDWAVHEALAFANTLANHGWTREANPDAASSCIYALCRHLRSPGNAAAMGDDGPASDELYAFADELKELAKAKEESK